MRLATLRDGSRDGALIVVSSDAKRYARAAEVAPTMQRALDTWEASEPGLRALAAALDGDAREGEALDTRALMAPLPRAYEWVDGSAYLNHVRLVRKARGAEPPATLETDPLVYQGGSGVLLGATEEIRLDDVDQGLDFEAELAVILGDVPQGTKAADAGRHVRLFVVVNDVTLRNLIPRELAKNFGFFCSKPATAFSPFAVTPDELGAGLDEEGRAHLVMRTTYNGDVVGQVHTGPEMHFSFHRLIEHVAQTRAFTAGTLLGSGTISNEDRSAGISCLAERRMIETIEEGAPRTPFMRPGDRVQIEARDAQGRNIFGTIDQKVVAGGG